MSAVDEALAAIRRVSSRLNTAEFARLSGVPYTTLREWEARGFAGTTVETLQKLAAAAIAFELTAPVADGEQDAA